ncbi:hypothetical protein BSKO_05754 [Bryopsis sp. KO-2023]|nr:hypothetical protein BSKO_05754 [Bryopsis sp. KO-2023]
MECMSISMRVRALQAYQAIANRRVWDESVTGDVFKRVLFWGPFTPLHQPVTVSKAGLDLRRSARRSSSRIDLQEEAAKRMKLFIKHLEKKDDVDKQSFKDKETDLWEEKEEFDIVAVSLLGHLDPQM